MPTAASLCPLFVGAVLTGQTAVWLSPATAHAPPLDSGALAADAMGRSIFYCGSLHQTWIYDGLDWHQAVTPASPSYRVVIGCFDTGRQRFVVISGNRSNAPSTFEWDGSTWLDRGPVPFAARDGEAVAYDSTRGVTVMFGGSQTGISGFADTWEWNGSTWTQRSSGGPFPRWNPSMAFDSARGVTVLFGGTTQLSAETALGDTWEWNGSYWLEHFGVPGPPPRRLAGLAYDSRRQRTVLFGGTGTTTTYSDTWEWDGAAWTHRTPAGTPSVNGALVYDAARGVCVEFEGSVAGLFEYVATATSAGSYTPFGQGCAGPAGVPDLAAQPGSLPAVGRTFTALLTNLPASPLDLPFAFLGYDNASWNGQPLPLALDPLGFTGCQAWIAPALDFTLTNVAGTATLAFAVPLDLDLVGVHFYLQGAVLAPGANPGGIVLSNAGHAVIGTP
jgi:hypothetical protein